MFGEQKKKYDFLTYLFDDKRSGEETYQFESEFAKAEAMKLTKGISSKLHGIYLNVAK